MKKSPLDLKFEDAQAPEAGSFLLLFFLILVILAQNAESAKNFQVQKYIVYGNMHYSLTRKIDFRVTSYFVIDWLGSEILILCYKTNFFLIYNAPLWIFKRFQNIKIQHILESSMQRNSAPNFRTFSYVEKKLLRLKKCTQAD